MAGRMICWVLVLAGVSSCVSAQATPDSVLAGLKSGDAGVRRAAQDEAVKLGAPVIAPLCALIAENTPMGISVAEKTLSAIVAQATAPGNDATRKAVSATLAEQSKSAPSDRARVAAVQCLGLVGGAEAIGPLSAALRDRVTFEAAREALMRVPGTEATRALIAALAGVPAEEQPAIALALGIRRDPTAVKPLLGLLKRADGAVRTATLAALGQIGDVSAAKALLAVAAQASDADRPTAVATVLTLADNARVASPKRAFALHKCALDKGATVAQRRAGLIGLTAAGDAGSVKVLLTRLADPELGPTVVVLLGELPDDKLAGPLLAELRKATGDRRAALLELGRARKVAGVPAG